MREHIFELDGEQYDNCVICGFKESEVCHGVGKHPHKFISVNKRDYLCTKCGVKVDGYERTTDTVEFRFKKNKNGKYIMIYQSFGMRDPAFDKKMTFLCPIGPDELMIESIIK